MSIAQKIEVLLNNSNDKSLAKFQEQYKELVSKGVIHPKGYNLAGINVIGDKVPTSKQSEMVSIASTYNN